MTYKILNRIKDLDRKIFQSWGAEDQGMKVENYKGNNEKGCKEISL